MAGPAEAPPSVTVAPLATAGGDDATSVALYNGMRMPRLGLGTWQLRGEECTAAVKAALAAGYRHIDTAAVYRNEAEVGAAVAASGIPRADIFITSKLQAKDHGPGAYDACLKSLEELGTPYLDLYLIHWPGVAGKAPDDPSQAALRRESWLALQRLHAEGKVKAIGVSNYMAWHVDELMTSDYMTIRPAVNQMELHPMLQQRDAVAACDRYGIVVEAYSSLARCDPALVEHVAVTGAAAAHGVTPHQVLLRWGLQHGWVVIPKSANPDRIVSNAQLFSWTLTDDEMAALDALDCGLRKCWDPTTIKG